VLAEVADASETLVAAMRENAGLHARLPAQPRDAGVLDERQRLAGEILDVLAQALTGIVTQLEDADERRRQPGHGQAAAPRTPSKMINLSGGGWPARSPGGR
jgi:signal transduction histidine kinase